MAENAVVKKTVVKEEKAKEPVNKEKLATSSMVLGILAAAIPGILLGFGYFVTYAILIIGPFIGSPIIIASCITGLILGGNAISKAKKSNGIATNPGKTQRVLGMVMGIIAVVIYSIILAINLFFAIGFLLIFGLPIFLLLPLLFIALLLLPVGIIIFVVMAITNSGVIATIALLL